MTNIRLKIFCALFAVFYVYSIGEYVYDGVPSFITGFKEGYKQGQDKSNSEATDTETEDICHIYLKPKENMYSFSSSVINQFDNRPIKMEISQAITKIKHLSPLPLWIRIMYNIGIFLSFPLLILLIYIPVIAFKTIRSIVRDDIFSNRNITRIRRIGYSLLIIFGFLLFLDWAEYQMSKTLISLSDYKVIFDAKSNYIFLFFGLITMLFAEILKISHSIKEENDLTI
ncbi:MAG: DUF2975 domain-containing protein [Tannerella sp.]|jgi:hypothetical protein|nr:DUF2975 domain-containing protein [Tannerella sp.]